MRSPRGLSPGPGLSLPVGCGENPGSGRPDGKHQDRTRPWRSPRFEDPYPIPRTRARPGTGPCAQGEANSTPCSTPGRLHIFWPKALRFAPDASCSHDTNNCGFPQGLSSTPRGHPTRAQNNWGCKEPALVPSSASCYTSRSGLGIATQMAAPLRKMMKPHDSRRDRPQDQVPTS